MKFMINGMLMMALFSVLICEETNLDMANDVEPRELYGYVRRAYTP